MASIARLRCGGEGGGISSNLKGAVTFSKHLAVGSVIRTSGVIFCLIMLTH